MPERNMDWWLWLATAVMLTAGLFLDRIGLAAAILTTGAQFVLMAAQRGGITSFAAQVRIAYLALLVLGLWQPLAFLHWIQFAGTWAMVLVGYCLLARCLSLLPMNRDRPLTGRLVIRTFLSPPTQQAVQHP